MKRDKKIYLHCTRYYHRFRGSYGLGWWAEQRAGYEYCRILIVLLFRICSQLAGVHSVQYGADGALL